MVLAKKRVKAGTLFGPLIAPLVPLDEFKIIPPRYTLWSEEAHELQGYDLSDDFLCNWIKFIRPCTRMQDANVIAYQQRGSVYFVVLRDILSSRELRVFVKSPRTPSAPSEQLSSLVQSLVNSYDNRTSVDRSEVQGEEEIVEEPTRKRAVKRKFTHETVAVEEPTFVLGVDDNTVEVVCMTESLLETVLVLPDVGPSKAKRSKKEKDEWFLMKARYESGEMTEEEKQQFENHEITLKQNELREANRLKSRAYVKQKVGKMTEAEKKAYCAKKRSYSKIETKTLREKLVQGLPLTPKEQSRLEKKQDQQRQYSAKKRMRAKTAVEKDDGPNKTLPKPTTTKKRERSKPYVASWRLKRRQGLPLTPKEQLAYEKVTTRAREDSRKRNRDARIAKGLDPEPMMYHKPGGKPYRKPPFAWQLTEQGRNADGESQMISKDDTRQQGAWSNEPDRSSVQSERTGSGSSNSLRNTALS